MANANNNVNKIMIKYDYPDFGTRFTIPVKFRNVRIQVNFPFPPIFAFPNIDRIHRIAIDFELSDKISEEPPRVFDPPIILTIYLTQSDLAFAQGNIQDVKIYKWINNAWNELEVIEYGFIAPPIRARYGERYIAYCKVKINSFEDPPIAVGK